LAGTYKVGNNIYFREDNQLRHELLVEIPEQAFSRAEDRLTRLLVVEGELHSVGLRLKSQKKRGKK